MQKKSILLVLILLVTFLTTGCPKRYNMRTPFFPGDFSLYNQRGDGTVTGKVFLKDDNGIDTLYPGSKVTLVESNDYTDEIFKAVKNGYRIDKISIASPISNFDRKAQGDAVARFTFEDLPYGTYWVFTTSTKRTNKYMVTSRTIYQKVNVLSSEAVDIVLKQ